MLVSEKLQTVPDHLIVTPDDRYYGEGLKILWVDWNPALIHDTLKTLERSPIRLIVHVFEATDTNLKWLLDVAYQADIIVINAGHRSPSELVKGHLIALDKTRHFGRKDLEQIFPGYIEDPTGTMLEWIGTMRNE